MITGLMIVVLVLGLAIGYIIGLFNKKIGNRMAVIILLIRNLKFNKKNLGQTPKKLKQFRRNAWHRRRLFWRLLSRPKKTS